VKIPWVKVATGAPSRQRAAPMMVVTNPAGDGERADAVGARVAEIGSPMADGSGSVLSRRP
jgi:hypothetical protein